jgi:hypothetical protein
MRRTRTLIALAAILSCAACAPPVTPTPAPERILAVDSDGRVIRRSTSDENARASFAAPMDIVWSALVLSYADLGIDPTVADRSIGRYGNGGFPAPRRLAGRPLSDFFQCGSGLTGPYIDSGRLTANVVTSIHPGPGGTTIATTYATGTLRRNEGTSTDPIICASTGALEEYLRIGIESRLTTKR